MKRIAPLALIASVLVLAGCQSHQMHAQAPQFGDGSPAYVSMSAGDRLGAAMLEDRIYIARTRKEGNAYANVPPQFEGE